MTARVDELLALIHLFYEAAAEQNDWDRALAATSTALGGDAVVFFVHDRADLSLLTSRLWGRPPDAMTEYERDFVEYDVGVDDLLHLGAGAVLTDEDVPASICRTNPFLGDFRPSWSIERYLAGTLFRDERRVGVLSVQAGASRKAFNEEDASFLKQLLPHAARAVQFGAQLEHAEQASGSFEDLCEHLGTGVFLLGTDGTVHFANATARRLLNRADGLAVKARRLTADVHTEDRALRRAISAARAVLQGEVISPAEALTVSRSSGGLPYNVLVIPSRFLRGRVESQASVVVLVGDPASRLGSSIEVIRQLYGLTRTEAVVARALASGDSLDDYADRAGIAVSTARWQLKQIQSKMGVRRQIDVVRILLTGPAALVSQNE